MLAAGCVFSAAGQKALVVRQSRYEIPAGGTVEMAAPQETLDFLKNARSRQVEIVNDGAAAGGGLVAAPNGAGDQILLGASLRTNPGEYTVKVSAVNAAGEQQLATLSIAVKPRVTVPSSAKRPPVVLLNGWVSGVTGACPIAGSSSDTFGNLAQYLVSDGVPVVYLFDNCLEDAGQTVETLGNDLGDFLKTIKFDNGTQVPQIDLVAFSMGGLIARSYLAGLQPNGALTPPASPLVRKLVLIATPNFGSYLAGGYVNSIQAGTQSAELIPGSALTWDLATWNAHGDDLRGVDAIAVIGNAGVYSSTLSAGVTLNNAGDGVVSLTSGSLGFLSQDAKLTRILPYCHVDPGAFTNVTFSTYSCSFPGIANVNSTAQSTGVIVRSFLAGSTDWQSIGSTPATDPYLSTTGGMFFTLVNGSGGYATDLSAATFGTVPLTIGGLQGTIFYTDFVSGTGTLTTSSASLGNVNCGTVSEPVGFTSSLRCKINATIIAVGPPAATAGRTVNAGTSITITGAAFGSQCSGCKVVATPSGSSTGQQLTTTAWSNNSITANLPANLSGLVTILVAAVSGSDAMTIMVNPQSSLAVTPSSLQFAYTVGGAAPDAQTVQIANGGTGTLAWSATASDTWLTVSPGSGTAPSTLSIAVSTAGLAAGTYTGSIQIAATGASNTPASIGVTLIVTDVAPALAVTPSTLSFQFANGGAAPAAQNVAIANTGGGSLAWTASSNAYWLAVSEASGNAPATLAVSVKPVNLSAGTYTGTVLVTPASGSPSQVAVTLEVTGNPPAGTITAVSNAASYQPGLAPATWVSIFGTNLSQSTASWQGSDFVDGKLPTSLQGVSVTINGAAAYIAYISPTQINVLAPDDAQTGSVAVQVTTGKQASNTLNAPKQAFAPAFFTIGSGSAAAAQHSDYSYVGAPGLLSGVATQPAKPGETILLYGTGFGPTNPALATGQLVTTAEPLANAVQITIGGVAVTPLFAGLVGPGLYQFNVTVPNVPNGDAKVAATIGGVSTQAGVTVAVQQ